MISTTKNELGTTAGDFTGKSASAAAETALFNGTLSAIAYVSQREPELANLLRDVANSVHPANVMRERASEIGISKRKSASYETSAKAFEGIADEAIKNFGTNKIEQLVASHTIDAGFKIDQSSIAGSIKSIAALSAEQQSELSSQSKTLSISQFKNMEALAAANSESVSELYKNDKTVRGWVTDIVCWEKLNHFRFDAAPLYEHLGNEINRAHHVPLDRQKDLVRELKAVHAAELVKAENDSYEAQRQRTDPPRIQYDVNLSQTENLNRLADDRFIKEIASECKIAQENWINDHTSDGAYAAYYALQQELSSLIPSAFKSNIGTCLTKLIDMSDSSTKEEAKNGDGLKVEALTKIDETPPVNVTFDEKPVVVIGEVIGRLVDHLSKKDLPREEAPADSVGDAKADESTIPTIDVETDKSLEGVKGESSCSGPPPEDVKIDTSADVIPPLKTPPPDEKPTPTKFEETTHEKKTVDEVKTVIDDGEDKVARVEESPPSETSKSSAVAAKVEYSTTTEAAKTSEEPSLGNEEIFNTHVDFDPEIRRALQSLANHPAETHRKARSIDMSELKRLFTEDIRVDGENLEQAIERATKRLGIIQTAVEPDKAPDLATGPEKIPGAKEELKGDRGVVMTKMGRALNNVKAFILNNKFDTSTAAYGLVYIGYLYHVGEGASQFWKLGLRSLAEKPSIDLLFLAGAVACTYSIGKPLIKTLLAKRNSEKMPSIVGA